MATKSQEILLKGNTTSASAVPSSLKVREIAINALDRSLFTNDGNSIVKLYTGTNKWFNVDGNANNALKLGGILASEYINKEAFNSHINNSTIHITANERTAWNNKWDFNEEVIKAVKVNAAVLSDKATKLATSRTLWGKPFDGSANVDGDLKDVGNITASGKATIQGDIISGGEVVAVAGEGTPAGVPDYSALTGKPSINGVTLLSGNNTLVSLGIQPAGDYATNSGVTTLLANYADKTFISNNYVGKTAFNNHTADSVIHITSAERTSWNAKWDYDEATIKAVKVTSASSADKLNSNAGTSAIPIYFDGGIPVQCTPSSLFSTFTNGYDASAGGWRLLMITIAGHTRSVVVGYSQTAGSVAWTGITGKPSTFTPSTHTHTASEVSGLPTSLKNPYKLTFGSKTYDGSAAATITASDLGALTAHQSIYTLTLQVNGTSKGVYNPTSAAKTINIVVPTKTSDITNDSGFITSAAIPTALKNPYAVEIKANGVSLGTYDGSAAAIFNLSAANVGAASKVHTHTASEVSGLPTNLSAFTNDVGYITGITKSMVEGVLTGDITSHTHTFASLNSKPTTLSGYGITDALICKYIVHKYDNQVYVILLCKVGTNTTNIDHTINGTFWATYAGIDRYQAAYINVHCSDWTYGHNEYYGFTSFGLGNKCRLVTCTYQSSQYLAITFEGIQSTTIYFDGSYTNILFTPILYYTINTGTVNNSEIYNSITEVSYNKIPIIPSVDTALTTSNYNSYTPTLTGTGASGTWGINISGNAATATNATNAANADTLDGYHASSFYKHATAYPSGSSEKPWHKIATFSQSIVGLQINTSITFYISEFYKSKSYGIFTVRARANADSASIEFLTVDFLVNAGISKSDIVATWKNTGDGNIVINVYANRAGWSSFSFRKIEEQAWGSPQDKWTTLNASLGNENCYSSIPSDENQAVSTNIDIYNNAASATKLQTPRTIYGQSFDGTKDIDGYIKVNVNSSPDTIADYIGLRLHRSVASSDDYGVALMLSAYQNKGLMITGGGLGGLISYYDGTSNTGLISFSHTGNVSIGTTTDNGYKLQVNGSERVYGDLIVDGEVSALVA